MRKNSNDQKNNYIPFSFDKNQSSFNVKEKIAEMIIEARIKKGISQEELAKKMGIKQPNIARWENGTASPSNESLEKIATALETELVLPKFKFLENKTDSVPFNIIWKFGENNNKDKTITEEYSETSNFKLINATN